MKKSTINRYHLRGAVWFGMFLLLLIVSYNFFPRDGVWHYILFGTGLYLIYSVDCILDKKVKGLKDD